MSGSLGGSPGGRVNDGILALEIGMLETTPIGSSIGLAIGAMLQSSD